MKNVTFSSWGLLTVAIVALIARSVDAQAGRPVTEIRGHGSFQSGGLAPPGLDQISINAWVDAEGAPHGTVAWTSMTHAIMPPASGGAYPWHLAVTNLLVSNGQAFIEAFVISCAQAPQDVGIPAFFTVVDSGNGSPLPDEIGVYLGPMASVTAGNFKLRSDSQTGPPGCELRGHGTWDQVVGVTGGGQLLNQISINAWLDGAGTPQGMIAWNAVLHQVPGDPGNPIYGPGPVASGHPWYIDVTALSMSGNVAAVQGVVVHSPQVPEEEGLIVSFTVEDLGNGGASPSDRLSGVAIAAGNFTVTSSCSVELVPYYCDLDGDGYWAVHSYPGTPPVGAPCVPFGNGDPGPCLDANDNDHTILCE